MVHCYLGNIAFSSVTFQVSLTQTSIADQLQQMASHQELEVSDHPQTKKTTATEVNAMNHYSTWLIFSLFKKNNRPS